MTAHRKTRRAMDGAIEAWRNRMGAWNISRSAADLADVLARHAGATPDRDAMLNRVTEELRTARIAEELRRLSLTAATAEIPGLGRRGVARLASADITCASDLSRPALEAVQGIGERGIVALLLWRDAATAAIDRSLEIEPSAITTAFEELNAVSLAEQERRKHRLNRLADELTAILDAMSVRSALPDGRLSAAIDAYQQAVADLRHLGLAEDQMRIQPTPAAKTFAPKVRRPGGSACPACGGSMVKRWARGGVSPARYFLGCANYPLCTGSRPMKSRKP